MAADSTSPPAGAMLAHMVYFTLKDPSPENCQKMLSLCHKHLTNHPGQLFYAAGTRATCYDRPVNDQDYHIALQLVFTDRATHDAYQAAPRHKQFISECQPLWAKVRVFDSDVAKS